MKYEIYIDSLFALNLGLNLYLLELTNCIIHHTATWKRVMSGALCGSIFSVLPLMLPGNVVILTVAGSLLSVVSMSLITFRIQGVRAYLQLLEILSVLTIILGAVLQYLLQRLPGGFHTPAIGILIMGACCFLGIRRLLQKTNITCECKVTLRNHKIQIRVQALVDTGNSLIEPISGAPVAVLDKRVFENLFLNEKPAGFRVIPYHTIDRRSGLMPGYLIPEMRIEWDGFCRDYHNIYVGIRQQDTGEKEHYKMIINPKMLRERKTG